MANKTDNLKIVERLLEIVKNELDYSHFPKPFKQEYMFLSNVLSDAKRKRENEFNEAFKEIVGQYKQTLAKEGYGWFRAPEKLCWLRVYINQLDYAIYGGKDHYDQKELFFNEKLKEGAYLDFINQIDRTALMTSEELKIHNEECNRIGLEILNEILAEEKKK